MNKNLIINSLETLIPLETQSIRRSSKRIADIPLKLEKLKGDTFQPSEAALKSRKKDIPRVAIERLFYAGMSHIEMGKILGASQATVCRLCKQYGFWDTRTQNKVKKMAADGMSLPQIAEEFGMPIRTLRNFLEKYKINTVGQSVLKNIPKDEIQELVNAGCTTREVSEKLGIDILTTGKLFEKHEISTLDYAINKAAKEYAQNPSQETKMKALEVIDNYLKELAQKESDLNDACSYEDYLQSLRLDFLEQLEHFRNIKAQPAGILKTLKEHKPANIDLVMGNGEHDIILKDMDSLYSADRGIQAMENKNIVDYLLNKEYIYGKYFNSLEKDILKMKYGISPETKDLDTGEIAYTLNLTRARIHQILQSSMKKLNLYLESNPELKNQITDII